MEQTEDKEDRLAALYEKRKKYSAASRYVRIARSIVREVGSKKHTYISLRRAIISGHVSFVHGKPIGPRSGMQALGLMLFAGRLKYDIHDFIVVGVPMYSDGE